ncbi:MAG: AraC family transcriptional regulator [Candidatus Synoicihabitans palmerolidicus]|nr:AraC family transcriptional regulator [Candidatus Synoicihabitans palmerolidicus]
METLPASKYSKSSLDVARRARILRNLETVLVTEGQCEDSMISLQSLSRSLKEKPHYVSQVINQDLGTNFYELVNRYLITRAQQLLIAAPNDTVLEIALTVGFNSKSTFNTAFRRYTGTTPTAFRTNAMPRT